MTNFCVDCVHFKSNHHIPLPPMCYHPQSRLLTGPYMPVSNARYEGKCGIEGKFFERRPDPPPRVSWWRSIFRRNHND